MRQTAITRDNIASEAEALAYLAECTLATVCDLINRSKPPRSETRRQMSIAQAAVDWARSGYQGGCGRMDDVLEAGSVEAWARKKRPEFFGGKQNA